MKILAESSLKNGAMKSVIDAIYSRRAVRDYSAQPVSEKAIEELIDAATRAPSAMNSQPWAFVIVQQHALLHEISDEAKKFLSQSSEWRDSSEHAREEFLNSSFDIFYGAKTLIVICAKAGGFEPIGDCYLAGQNLMLAATAMGLATCPIGFARDLLGESRFRRRLDIPEDYDPVLPIALGYNKSSPPVTPRAPAKIISWVREQT